VDGVLRGDFTRQAGAYERARPGYPRELARALAECAGVRPGARVCEIGAGTGAFTRSLAELGLVVRALEPNAAMRARGAALDLAGVTWIDGSFETTRLADASQDWAVAAQAFHWAEPARALPELHRVLRPRACFTVLWNERENEREPTLALAWARVQQEVPGFDDLYKGIDWGAVLESTGHFATVACHCARHRVPMDRERFVMLWKSHLALSQAAGPERLARILAAIERDLAANDVAGVEVPYLCRAWTARAVAHA
jgi:ubiquinone/menaquinone biosynthesis C-methylase UbiE